MRGGTGLPWKEGIQWRTMRGRDGVTSEQRAAVAHVALEGRAAGGVARPVAMLAVRVPAEPHSRIAAQQQSITTTKNLEKAQASAPHEREWQDPLSPGIHKGPLRDVRCQAEAATHGKKSPFLRGHETLELCSAST